MERRYNTKMRVLLQAADLLENLSLGPLHQRHGPHQILSFS